MKKALTILLAAALVCAMAAAASATALETSGELRVRGWYLNNYLQNKKSTEFWDQRLRLVMNWPVSDTVKVQARADIYEGFWGDNQSATVSKVTGADIGNLQITTASAAPWEAKQQIWFDWANMQFQWPNTPLTFILGRQDVTWGTGFYAQADNRDRFKIVGKFDPVTVVFAYDKSAEVFLDHATRDDARGFTLGATTTVGGFKVGALGVYVLDESRLKYTGDLKYVAGDVFAMGKAGIIDLKGEFAYLSGTIENDAPLADVDVTGMGAYVGAFVPVGIATIGLEGAYAQGDKPSTAKNEGFFRSDYQGPFWSVIFYQNMDLPGYGAVQGVKETSDYKADYQVSNAFAGKLSAVLSPMKGLTVIANALYVAADKVAAGSKAVGTEFDLVLVYGITDNVSLTLGGGYAILGDFWKGKMGAVAGDKPDNPLGGVMAFNVKF